MTLTNAINRVRRLSRTTSAGKTDAEVVDTINDGMEEFAKAVHGIATELYVDIEPFFDTATNFAIRLTVTGGTDATAAVDVPITATARSNVAGTQVATDLQTAIQAAGAATTTVAWSTTTWKFTITTPADTTSVTIAAPSAIIYVDACDLLGFSGTDIGYDWTGSLPDYCLVETALPTGFLSIIPPVEWDENQLRSIPWSATASPYTGTPTHYSIKDKKIRLYPAPRRQEMFHLWYKAIPTKFTRGYQEFGLSDCVGTTETGLAATTTYYFKVTINGGTQAEYSITTAADTTFDAVDDLLDDAVTADGITVSLVAGDLRFTSDLFGTSSAIAVVAGTTGTDLLAALTGFTAVDTAVAGLGTATAIALDDEDAMGAVYFAASLVAEENFEDKRADRCFARFMKYVNNHIIRHANAQPAMIPADVQSINHTVDASTLS